MMLSYAFVDESGSVEISGMRDWCLVMAAVVIDSPKPLELLVKRAFKRFGANPAVAEFKAAHSDDKTVRWMLQEMAMLDVAIVVVTAGRRRVENMPKDPETVYRHMAARVARLCVERWPRLQMVIDKRYTHEHLRQRLEWAMREQVADVPQQALVIRQEDSRHVKSLQVADFVAWACWQHYRGQDSSFREVIRSRIVVEERMTFK